MVYDCLQAYGPGIIIIIDCEAPVIVYIYMALYKWFIIIIISSSSSSSSSRRRRHQISAIFFLCVGPSSVDHITELVVTMVDQSINQSIKFYNTNIPGEARLSWAAAESVFKSKIEDTAP